MLNRRTANQAVSSDDERRRPSNAPLAGGPAAQPGTYFGGFMGSCGRQQTAVEHHVQPPADSPANGAPAQPAKRRRRPPGTGARQRAATAEAEAADQDVAPKRRGRPPGSKNKKRKAAEAVAGATAAPASRRQTDSPREAPALRLTQRQRRLVDLASDPAAARTELHAMVPRRHQSAVGGAAPPPQPRDAAALPASGPGFAAPNHGSPCVLGARLPAQAPGGSSAARPAAPPQAVEPPAAERQQAVPAAESQQGPPSLAQLCASAARQAGLLQDRRHADSVPVAPSGRNTGEHPGGECNVI